MRTADLPAADSAGSRARLRAGALVAALLLVGGCGAETHGGGGSGGGGGGGGGVLCAADTSRSLATAYPATLETTLQDTFCPGRDEDYWQLTTLLDNQLIDFELTYRKLGNVRLAAEWLGPMGLCLSTPQLGCGAGGGCNPGDACDIDHGGCHAPGASACLLGRGCSTGEACDVATESLAALFESVSGGADHRLAGTLRAAEAGSYTLRVYSTETVADAGVSYDLLFAQRADPDTHEPNETPTMALPLAPGNTVEGYLAYAGDVDWFPVSHSLTSEPVVTVELSWPLGAQMDPTWTLVTEGEEVAAPAAIQEGVGAATRKVRRRKRILPAGSAVAVRIEQQVGAVTSGVEGATPYTLTVWVEEDLVESSGRNDTPESATVMAIGAPAASPAPLVRVDSLVAANDTDWFRIDRPAALTDNTLLRMIASADTPEQAGFLLRLDLYRRCDPAVVGDCGSGVRALLGGESITPWFVFPYVHSRLSDPNSGAGAFQMGGNSPNYLDAQLPLSLSGNGAYYLRVSHIDTTPLYIPGHSPQGVQCQSAAEVGCYELRLEHYLEPDLDDRQDPDNHFIPDPLRPSGTGGAFYGRADFWRRDRVIPESGAGGPQWLFVAATGRSAVVQLPQAATLTLPDCAPLALSAVDATGLPAVTTTLDLLSASGGTFVTDCASATPIALPLQLAGSAPAIAFVPPAIPQSVTVTARTLGESFAIESTLEVVEVGVTPAVITVEAPPGFPVGGATPLRIWLPAAVTTTPVVLTLSVTSADAAAAPVVACAGTFGATCPGLDHPAIDPPIPPGERCSGALTAAAGGLATCKIAVISGDSYELLVNAAAPGPVTLAVAPEGGAWPRAFATLVAYTGASLELGDADGDGSGSDFYGSGYLSYMGDQDFFRIPVPADLPGRMQMTVRLISAASPLEVRVQATRSELGERAGVAAALAVEDLCGRCTAGSCDARGYCDGVAGDIAIGAAGALPECAFVVPGGDIEIWVNDVLANDWSLTQPYQFAVYLTEGCPPSCSAAICGQ